MGRCRLFVLRARRRVTSRLLTFSTVALSLLARKLCDLVLDGSEGEFEVEFLLEPSVVSSPSQFDARLAAHLLFPALGQDCPHLSERDDYACLTVACSLGCCFDFSIRFHERRLEFVGAPKI